MLRLGLGPGLVLGLGLTVFTTTTLAAPTAGTHPAGLPAKSRAERWLHGKLTPSIVVQSGPSFNLPLADHRVRYTLDVELGFRYGFAAHRRLGLVGGLRPVVGYSFDTGELAGGHLFAAGVGLGLHSRRLIGALSLQLRFLVGRAGDHPRALGFRTGLRYELFMGFFSLALNYQVLRLPGQTVHGFRLVLGVDFVDWVRLGMEALNVR
jgi:hypothetical protein